MGLHIYRLNPNDPESWQLFPVLERRIREFLPRYGVELQLEPLLAEMRARWVTTPDLAGYWLALSDGEPVAHLVSWAMVEQGEPFIHVNQLERDQDGPSIREFVPVILSELDKWASELNRRYELAGRPERFRDVEFWTMHDREFWGRYLPREIRQLRHVLRFAVEEPATERPVKPNGDGRRLPPPPRMAT